MQSDNRVNFDDPIYLELALTDPIYADALRARKQQQIDGKKTIYDMPSWRIEQIIDDPSCATPEEQDAFERFDSGYVYVFKQTRSIWASLRRWLHA